MPHRFGNTQYYSSIEVCRATGISKATLLRWLRQNTINLTIQRDRRGWRIFSVSDLKLIDNEANRTYPK